MTCHKSEYQPGKVAKPARDQLSKEKKNSHRSPSAPENLVSRDGPGSPVPRQPAHLYIQAESSAYLRDYSRFPRRRPLLHLKPSCAIGSVPSLSVHAIAYRWRSLQRVHRHRSSKPQCSSSNGCYLCITMDQLICAFLSHTGPSTTSYPPEVLYTYMYARLSHSKATHAG